MPIIVDFVRWGLISEIVWQLSYTDLWTLEIHTSDLRTTMPSTGALVPWHLMKLTCLYFQVFENGRVGINDCPKPEFRQYNTTKSELNYFHIIFNSNGGDVLCLFSI